MDGSLPARTAPPPPHAGAGVEDLRNVFLADAGAVRAMDGVSFADGPGGGWASSARADRQEGLGALPDPVLEEPARIVGGAIRFQGRDVLAMRGAELRIGAATAPRGVRSPMSGLKPVIRICAKSRST